jgi:hypothetical protein
MKLLFCISAILLALNLSNATAQEVESFKPYGKASGLIFANFHKGISSASSNASAFELVRAYLEYKHNLSTEFSARITLDVGSPDDISPYSRIRRYAYFKYAYGEYTRENLKIQFGLISTLQFKLQEDLWERRYLKKAFADEFKLGSSADLGASVVYDFNPSFKADFTMMNGEGYTRLQMDDAYKYAIGLTYSFRDQFINRFYMDYMKNGIAQSTYTWVSSYTHKNNLNLVFEYNHQYNNNLAEGRDLYGYSMYGKYNLTPAYQLFARYDILKSNVMNEGENPWHLAEDGSMLIAGLQFIPVKGIKLALNYQDWVPLAANMPTQSFIFLDMEIRL